MDFRTVWYKRDGWWQRKDWNFEVKFTEVTEQTLNEAHSSELQLPDVVQNVTHVQMIRRKGLGIEALFDAMVLSEPSQLQFIGIKDHSLFNDYLESSVFGYHPAELENLNMLSRFAAFGHLAKAIERGCLRSLKHLDLSGGSRAFLREVALAGSTQVMSLVEALSSGKLPKLSRLSLGCNSIGIEGAKSIALAIRSGELKNLVELDLSETSIGDEGLIALSNSFQEGVVKLLPNLTMLSLSWNSFGELGMLALAEVFSSGTLPKLRRLGLGRNKFGIEGAKSIALAIRSGELKNLVELDLSETGIGDEGLIALSNSFQEGVVKLLPNLKNLNLSFNSFGELGMLALTEVFSSGTLPNLRRLGLGRNKFGIEGAKSIALAIGSGELKNLVELDLSETGIGDEGLIALSNSFQEGVVKLLPNLTNLNLSFNSFGELGMLSLVEALASGRLNSLWVLDVHYCLKVSSSEVANALVSAYLRNSFLTVDVKFEWFWFPELDRRREELIERNSRNRDILAKLETVSNVQASFAKVYICGNPNVGKTTLRRTLQRSFWKSLWMWEKRPHQEKQTRGIEVSQVSSRSSKADEEPITLQVWDMAGQEDFHLIHNAFFPDLRLAEGKATTFIVVCSSRSGLHTRKEQLQYWLRYIASSCDKNIQNPRHVFVVMNNIGGGQKINTHAEHWKQVLEDEKDAFEILKIQTGLFLLDVRAFQHVKSLKNCLLEHSRNLLRNQEVPKICHTIQKNLCVWIREREQFPVLQWTEFVREVLNSQREPWPEHIIEAATKYLNEAGVVIYLQTNEVTLVVVDPNWLCREIIGKVFLPRDMASPRELLFRQQVDKTTGSISILKFKKFFKSLKSEWDDAQVNNLITILLWLGLCYKGRDENMFIPGLISEKGTPGHPWCSRIPVEHGADQWVMGFSVMHQKSEVALAPISLWHRFQVDLAQSVKFDSQIPDNDFIAGKYFMTFVMDYMKVLIEVDANPDKPTFAEISIQVKPMFGSNELGAAERKQCQVDLASYLVERLLKLWNQVCPGVEYVQKVIWPWPASWSRPQSMPERNVQVAEVKKWVQERGMGRKMQWDVGSGSSITEGQLLSTKDQRQVVQSVEHTLSIVTQGIKEAVNLKIFPPDVLIDEVFLDDSVLASNGIAMPTSSAGEEQDEMYSKLSKLLKPIDNKVDKLYKKLNNVENLVRKGFGEVLQKQKQLLHKLQDTERIFSEDRESICSKFIYLGTTYSAWVTLKDALSLSTTIRLRFACEAHYNNYRPHVDVRKSRRFSRFAVDRLGTSCSTMVEGVTYCSIYICESFSEYRCAWGRFNNAGFFAVEGSIIIIGGNSSGHWLLNGPAGENARKART